MSGWTERLLGIITTEDGRGDVEWFNNDLNMVGHPRIRLPGLLWLISGRAMKIYRSDEGSLILVLSVNFFGVTALYYDVTREMNRARRAVNKALERERRESAATRDCSRSQSL